jgi:hypothetical protein
MGGWRRRKRSWNSPQNSFLPSNNRVRFHPLCLLCRPHADAFQDLLTHAALIRRPATLSSLFSGFIHLETFSPAITPSTSVATLEALLDGRTRRRQHLSGLSGAAGRDWSGAGRSEGGKQGKGRQAAPVRPQETPRAVEVNPRRPTNELRAELNSLRRSFVPFLNRFSSASPPPSTCKEAARCSNRSRSSCALLGSSGRKLECYEEGAFLSEKKARMGSMRPAGG